MRLVVVETPYGHTTERERDRNAAYLAACLADCYKRGEAPIASHAVGPLALDDKDPAERAQGIRAGLLWGRKADARVVYIDLGVSEGMSQALDDSAQHRQDFEKRRLRADWAGQWERKYADGLREEIEAHTARFIANSVPTEETQ